jgi:hypothetical protein
MLRLLAATVITLVAGSLQPVPQPRFQQINPQFNQTPAEPFFELPVPMPSTVEKSAIINIHPYGPSFQFNDLTVYVEPVALASSPGSGRK